MTMSNAGQNLAKARAIITSACSMLHHAQQITHGFGRDLPFSSADCYVLLQDATKLFCHYVSELYGEPYDKRWSSALPELLLSHPDRCEETLALVEQREFKELSFLHFVAA
jgi:hypothetical protein